MHTQALKARQSAAPDASRAVAEVRYHATLQHTKALKHAERAARREPTGYTATCDDVACNVCRKGVGEKAPWNR
jgi:hypothetical protein